MLELQRVRTDRFENAEKMLERGRIIGGLPAGDQGGDIRDGSILRRWRTGRNVVRSNEIAWIDRCVVHARMIVSNPDRLVEFSDGIVTALSAVDRLHDGKRSEAENAPVFHRAFSLMRAKNILAAVSHAIG